MSIGSGGAGAYAQLRRTDNPVSDSIKSWGMIMSQKNDQLNQQNNKIRETMLNTQKEWIKENSLTPEMFDLLTTENPDFDKQSHAYANQVKEEYLKAYKEGDEAMRNGDFTKNAQLQSKMKLMLNGFKQVTNMSAKMKEGIEAYKAKMATGDYDTYLNADLEDMMMSAYDTKNMVISMNPKTMEPQLVYPSRDGGIRIVSMPALLTGKVFESVPEVDALTPLNDIVSKIKEDEVTGMDPNNKLMRNTKIEWSDDKQALVERLLSSKFTDLEMKNLYRKWVDPMYRNDGTALTEEQKDQAIKNIARGAKELFKEKDESVYDASAVSMRNVDENNKVKVSEGRLNRANNKAIADGRNATALKIASMKNKDEGTDEKEPIYGVHFRSDSLGINDKDAVTIQLTDKIGFADPEGKDKLESWEATYSGGKWYGYDEGTGKFGLIKSPIGVFKLSGEKSAKDLMDKVEKVRRNKPHNKKK